MVPYQRRILFEIHPNWQGAAFPAVLENRGVIRSYRTIKSDSYAVALSSQKYRGEVWMQGAPRDAIVNSVTTPNSLNVQTDGREGTVIFNVNYDPGWKTRTPGVRDPVSASGLLAVRLPAGSSGATLQYRPAAFTWGVLVTALMITMGVAILGLAIRKRHTAARERT
jgi:uncharacterized membrane protein YfhO